MKCVYLMDVKPGSVVQLFFDGRLYSKFVYDINVEEENISFIDVEYPNGVEEISIDMKILVKMYIPDLLDMHAITAGLKQREDEFRKYRNRMYDLIATVWGGEKLK